MLLKVQFVSEEYPTKFCNESVWGCQSWWGVAYEKLTFFLRYACCFAELNHKYEFLG